MLHCMYVCMRRSGAIPAYDPDTQESLQLYVGIIDVLQSYRFAKKFEHTVKSLVHDAVSFTPLSVCLSQLYLSEFPLSGISVNVRELYFDWNVRNF